VSFGYHAKEDLSERQMQPQPDSITLDPPAGAVPDFPEFDGFTNSKLYDNAWEEGIGRE